MKEIYYQLSEKEFRKFAISSDMEKHFSIPINHAETILYQINSGMYAKYFDGKKDLRCIDFGANVGLVSLYMAQFSKELYCVEPTPNHFKLLKELLDSNCGECNVHYYDIALNGANEDVYFRVNQSTENKITSVNDATTIKVKGVTLSSFLEASNADKEIIDFVKCDIEGGEIFAITNEELKKTKGKIRTFFVECHPSENYGMDECREELIKRFLQHSYVIEFIDYQTFAATYDC